LLSPLGIRFAKEKQQVYFHVLSTFALNSWFFCKELTALSKHASKINSCTATSKITLLYYGLEWLLFCLTFCTIFSFSSALLQLATSHTYSLPHIKSFTFIWGRQLFVNTGPVHIRTCSPVTLDNSTIEPFWQNTVWTRWWWWHEDGSISTSTAYEGCQSPFICLEWM
jgi:hypothetical protein